MSHTVYRIYNAINGKVYVGQTLDVVRRFKTHMAGYRSPRMVAPDLRLDVDRYGRSFFSLEVLCVCATRKEALDQELFYIERFSAYDPAKGYNRRPSGGCGLGNVNAKARMVQQYTKEGVLVATFRSVKKASEVTGIHRTAINGCINFRRQKTAGGFTWQATGG